MSRRRIAVLALLLGAIAVLAAAAFAAQRPITYANIAIVYAAKQTCSCRFISGRSMESCLGDFPQDAQSQFQITETGHTIRASVFFGAFQSEAKYEDGFGCSIVND